MVLAWLSSSSLIDALSMSEKPSMTPTSGAADGRIVGGGGGKVDSRGRRQVGGLRCLMSCERDGGDDGRRRRSTAAVHATGRQNVPAPLAAVDAGSGLTTPASSPSSSSSPGL